MKKIGFLALLLLFSSFLAIGTVYAPSGTNYYLEFQGEPFSTRQKTWGPTPVPIGTIFTVEVYVENTTDAYTLYCSIDWDPAVLNLSSHYDPLIPGWVPHIYQGDWLAGQATGFLIGGVNYVTGLATDITYGRMGMVPGKTGAGPGLVCTVEFVIVGFTSSYSDIDLFNVNILNSMGENYWGTDQDSPYDLEVEVLTPPPTSPTAAFTWSPPFPLEGTVANFNAGGSSPGFDGNTTRPITEYRWDWENDGIIDDTVGTPTTTHTFPMAGSYDVNLTVYAPPGMGADPGYDPYDSVVHTVLVIAPTVGRNIDLYTQDTRYPGYTTEYTGEGAPEGTQVDSYAPQDIVILYANVTYNNEPVAHKLVVFKIKGPINEYENISFYRTAMTDETGIAWINFTIPVPCDHFEEKTFGNWTIEAKVSIVEEWVDDNHWFLVGWIVEKTVLSLGDGIGGWGLITFEELSTVYFKATIESISLTPRNVTMTAVIYDELGVPIGSNLWVRGEIPYGTSVFNLVTIFIPEWAFIGWGNVYFNCYTKDPWACGIPYCPENVEPIQIVPGP